TVTVTPVGAGTVTISITATDEGGAATTASFALQINPANQPPTLDPIPDTVLTQGGGPVTIPLTGIGPGPGDSNQIVALSAETPDQTPVAKFTITYTNPSDPGPLSFRSVPATAGTATITVFITDGQATNNLFSQVFHVTINDAPAIMPPTDITVFE